MTKQNKYLVIFFIVLLLLVLGEVLFYFFKYPKNDNLIQSNSKEQQSHEFVTRPITTSDKVTYLTNYLDSSTLTSSYLVTEFDGEIDTIDTDGGVIQGDVANDFISHEYQIGFSLKNIKDEPENYFAFNEDHADRIVVVERVNNEEKDINFTDLNNGDKIKLTLRLDMKKDIFNNIIEGKIIKLQ